MPIIDRALLEKYIKGECSPEEEALILQWIDETDSDEYPVVHGAKKYRHKLEKGWIELTGSVEELQPYSPIKRLSKKKWWWAAAAAIAVLMGFSLWMFLPGLLGSFRYEMRYQTSYGEIKRINLPDGTAVTLNSESTLEIEKGFNKKNRVVSLRGEAFFDVKHDAAIPFEVETKHIVVKVLGTSFNVSAFNNDPDANVLLKNGKVMVREIKNKGGKSVLLSPGETAIYRKENASLEIKQLNPKVQLAWQQRVIAFQDADMKEVVHQIERYFGVTIDISHLPQRQWKLTGEYKDQSLEGILQSLSFSYGIKYSIEEDKVELYDK